MGISDSGGSWRRGEVLLSRLPAIEICLPLFFSGVVVISKDIYYVIYLQNCTKIDALLLWIAAPLKGFPLNFIA